MAGDSTTEYVPGLEPCGVEQPTDPTSPPTDPTDLGCFRDSQSDRRLDVGLMHNRHMTPDVSLTPRLIWAGNNPQTCSLTRESKRLDVSLIYLQDGRHMFLECVSQGRLRCHMGGMREGWIFMLSSSCQTVSSNRYHAVDASAFYVGTCLPLPL